uniref:Ig-like domain-containing protein n=1 Tax=Sus scrofa TaxID=9823 RepID=A0A8D0VQ79_PIG
MGPYLEDPLLCWLLRFFSLLVSVYSSGTNGGGPAPGVQDSGAPDPLQGIRGGSVLFPLQKKQDAELEEVTWGFGPASEYRVLLRVRPGEAPTWASLQDRYQQRVHVPNMTSLKIENLTPEDSGLYRARGSFTGGVEFTQVFHLTVYEPVTIPQILVHSSSITPGWCNVTMECRTSGDAEDLKVTWEGKGLPRELEERVTSGPTPNSWTLAVHLPQSQPYTNITCVVSNEVDQKTATFNLGEVCVHGSHGQAKAVALPGILGAGATVATLLLILGIGLCLWKKKKKKKMETARGRLPFSFLAEFSPLTLPPAFCCSRNTYVEGMVDLVMALGFITVGEGMGFQGPGSSFTLCMTLEQDCRRSLRTVTVASNM